MNIWVKRLFMTLSIGGGFTGIAVTASAVGQVKGNPLGYALLGVMAALFAFGVYAGLVLGEDESRGLHLLRVFFALQVPVVSSPIAAYHLAAGLGIFLSFSFTESRLLFFFRLGGEMGFALFQQRPWVLGVNVAGLALFLCTMFIRTLGGPLAGGPIPPPLPGESPDDDGGDEPDAAARHGVVEGGIYALPEGGAYLVFKVLKVDEQGVHVRKYANRFSEWPTQLDETALRLTGDTPESPPGTGHLPVSHASFQAWKGHFLQRAVVRDGELAGYRQWRQAGGGYV